MNDDPFDDEEEFPDLPSGEEDEQIDLPLFATPRLSLGDMFERLPGEKDHLRGLLGLVSGGRLKTLAATACA